MKHIAYFATISLSLTLIRGESEATVDCGKEYRTSDKCVIGHIKTTVKNMPYTKIDKKKLEQDVDKCFTEAGCADLAQLEASALDDGDRSGESGADELYERLSDVAAILNIDDKRVRDIIGAGVICLGELATRVKPDIELCVRELRPAHLASFTLPEQPRGLTPDAYSPDGKEIDDGTASADAGDYVAGHPVVAFAVRMAAFFERQTEDVEALALAVFNKRVCNTTAKQNRARKCISQTINKALPKQLKCVRPTAGVFEFFESVRNLCDKRDACHRKVSEPCATLGPQLPRMVCTCAEAYLNDNFDDIAQQMLTCINDKLDADEPLTLPPALVRGPLKKIATDALKEKCDGIDEALAAADLCADDYDPFNLPATLEAKSKAKAHLAKAKGVLAAVKAKGRAIAKAKSKAKGKK